MKVGRDINISGLFTLYKVKFVCVSCPNRSVTDTMNWNKGGPGTKRGFGFGGFAISAGKKEEPKLPQQSHSAFGATSSSSGFGKSAPPQLPSFYKIGSKRANFDEENA